MQEPQSHSTEIYLLFGANENEENESTIQINNEQENDNLKNKDDSSTEEFSKENDKQESSEGSEIELFKRKRKRKDASKGEEEEEEDGIATKRRKKKRKIEKNSKKEKSYKKEKKKKKTSKDYEEDKKDEVNEKDGEKDEVNEKDGEKDEEKDKELEEPEDLLTTLREQDYVDSESSEEERKPSSTLSTKKKIKENQEWIEDDENTSKSLKKKTKSKKVKKINLKYEEKKKKDALLQLHSETARLLRETPIEIEEKQAPSFGLVLQSLLDKINNRDKEIMNPKASEIENPPEEDLSQDEESESESPLLEILPPVSAIGEDSYKPLVEEVPKKLDFEDDMHDPPSTLQISQSINLPLEPTPSLSLIQNEDSQTYEPPKLDLDFEFSEDEANETKEKNTKELSPIIEYSGSEDEEEFNEEKGTFEEEEEDEDDQLLVEPDEEDSSIYPQGEDLMAEDEEIQNLYEHIVKGRWREKYEGNSRDSEENDDPFMTRYGRRRYLPQNSKDDEKNSFKNFSFFHNFDEDEHILQNEEEETWKGGRSNKKSRRKKVIREEEEEKEEEEKANLGKFQNRIWREELDLQTPSLLEDQTSQEILSLVQKTNVVIENSNSNSNSSCSSKFRKSFSSVNQQKLKELVSTKTGSVSSSHFVYKEKPTPKAPFQEDENSSQNFQPFATFQTKTQSKPSKKSTLLSALTKKPISTK